MTNHRLPLKLKAQKISLVSYVKYLLRSDGLFPLGPLKAYKADASAPSNDINKAETTGGDQPEGDDAGIEPGEIKVADKEAPQEPDKDATQTAEQADIADENQDDKAGDVPTLVVPDDLEPQGMSGLVLDSIDPTVASDASSINGFTTDSLLDWTEQEPSEAKEDDALKQECLKKETDMKPGEETTEDTPGVDENSGEAPTDDATPKEPEASNVEESGSTQNEGAEEESKPSEAGNGTPNDAKADSVQESSASDDGGASTESGSQPSTVASSVDEAPAPDAVKEAASIETAPPAAPAEPAPKDPAQEESSPASCRFLF